MIERYDELPGVEGGDKSLEAKISRPHTKRAHTPAKLEVGGGVELPGSWGIVMAAAAPPVWPVKCALCGDTGWITSGSRCGSFDVDACACNPVDEVCALSESIDEEFLTCPRCGGC